jgi:hypothetical protein
MDLAQVFHSTTDFLDHVLDPVKALSPRFYQDTQGSYNDAEWYGVRRENKLGEQAGMTVARLVRDGWPEGVRLMEQVQSQIAPPQARSIRRRAQWSDQGDDLNLQRLYAGNIDRMWHMTTKQISTGPSRIRIIVDSIAPAVEEADRMRWRGVAALKLADILTSAGYTVQVESAFTGYGGGDNPRVQSGKRTLRVIVKPYSAPLDLNSLAATTALPGFFRALGHAWAGGSMSVPQLKASDVTDESDKAMGVIISQQVLDAKSATDCVNKTVEQLDSYQNSYLEA